MNRLKMLIEGVVVKDTTEDYMNHVIIPERKELVERAVAVIESLGEEARGTVTLEKLNFEKFSNPHELVSSVSALFGFNIEDETELKKLLLNAAKERGLTLELKRNQVKFIHKKM